MDTPITALLDTYFAAEDALTKRLRTHNVDGPLVDERSRHWMLVDGKLVMSEGPFTPINIESGDTLYSFVLVPFNRHKGYADPERAAVVRIENVVLVNGDGQVDFIGAEVFVLDPNKECTDSSLRDLYAQNW